MKTIICSHGFGVKADSRGMFTDIAAGMPEYEFRMFNYNDEQPNGDTYVRSLDEMAVELGAQLYEARGEIVLLCHSLGCVVAGLADLSKVSKVVLLAPPDEIPQEPFIDRLRQRKGSIIDLHATSILPRSDGSTTYIPLGFFTSMASVKPRELYQKIATAKPTVIIRALKDEMLGFTDVGNINNVELISMDSDHNFTGENRQKLITELQNILS